LGSRGAAAMPLNIDCVLRIDLPKVLSKHFYGNRDRSDDSCFRYMGKAILPGVYRGFVGDLGCRAM